MPGLQGQRRTGRLEENVEEAPSMGRYRCSPAIHRRARDRLRVSLPALAAREEVGHRAEVRARGLLAAAAADGSGLLLALLLAVAAADGGHGERDPPPGGVDAEHLDLHVLAELDGFAGVVQPPAGPHLADVDEALEAGRQLDEGAERLQAHDATGRLRALGEAGDGVAPGIFL